MGFARLQLRRDSAADWTTANPVLADGELGIETDTRRMKLGDGTTAWNSLPYMAGYQGGYVHTQGSASTTWTINHNLGFNPSVEVLSVGGMELDADVHHASVNQTLINFVTATAGTARLV